MAKMATWFGKAVLIASIIIFFGTAGALDRNMVSFADGVSNMVLSLGTAALGFIAIAIWRD